MDFPVQVERHRKLDGKKYKYIDVEYDSDNWVDAKRFLPVMYDLCLLRTELKTYHGWHNGLDWDGANIRPGMKILYWKRREY